MEKSNQKEVEYMSKLWIDTRLNQEEMDFLWSAISEENKEDASKKLAGNISKSELIEDKDNWFYETVLKKLTERMFYRDWDNFSKYHIEVEEGIPLPEFGLTSLWVNYQRQYEFNPLHHHGGLFSFVIFMKIPTHWKEQHALPISANSSCPVASDFAFVWSEKDSEIVKIDAFRMSPENEGRMLFFPATLQHQVYPFYGTEEERITISGNIRLYDPNRPEEQELLGDVYEEKEKMLEMMKNGVQQVEEELKQMKKEREKEG
jgi:hypothetical protein